MCHFGTKIEAAIPVYCDCGSKAFPSLLLCLSYTAAPSICPNFACDGGLNVPTFVHRRVEKRSNRQRARPCFLSGALRPHAAPTISARGERCEALSMKLVIAAWKPSGLVGVSWLLVGVLKIFVYPVTSKEFPGIHFARQTHQIDTLATFPVVVTRTRPRSIELVQPKEEPRDSFEDFV